MNERMIGDVRVTRVEELIGPFFGAKELFPDFDAAAFAEHEPWPTAPRPTR